jgi:hypothetical protein
LGTGPVGLELKHLPRRDLEVARARRVDPIAFQGYLEGLRDTGWESDPRLVRFGQIGHHVMRGITTLGVALRWFTDETRHGWSERRAGCSMEESADRLAESARHPKLDWDNEAWKLSGEL